MQDRNTREQTVGVVKEYRLDHTYDLVFSWSYKMSIREENRLHTAFKGHIIMSMRGLFFLRTNTGISLRMKNRNESKAAEGGREEERAGLG